MLPHGSPWSPERKAWTAKNLKSLDISGATEECAALLRCAKSWAFGKMDDEAIYRKIQEASTFVVESSEGMNSVSDDTALDWMTAGLCALAMVNAKDPDNQLGLASFYANKARSKARLPNRAWLELQAAEAGNRAVNWQKAGPLR